jgi:L-ascorbate metabolism protein UlaG (beta-lactamase superfamily)
MEIWSLGHSSFRLRGKEAILVLDPPSPGYGASLKGISADIVCVTHDHPGHNNVAGVGGTPYVVRGPGEYEVGGVLISALRAFHDAKRGEERGGNNLFAIHMDDLLICHLGDLGHPLTATQQEEINGCDILMVPVGGHTTINAQQAADLVSAVEPSIIIPMHYGTGNPPKSGIPLDPVDAFCHAMGAPIPEAQPKLVVTRANIPAAPQIVILTQRGQS